MGGRPIFCFFISTLHNAIRQWSCWQLIYWLKKNDNVPHFRSIIYQCIITNNTSVHLTKTIWYGNGGGGGTVILSNPGYIHHDGDYIQLRIIISVVLSPFLQLIWVLSPVSAVFQLNLVEHGNRSQNSFTFFSMIPTCCILEETGIMILSRHILDIELLI